ERAHGVAQQLSLVALRAFWRAALERTNQKVCITEACKAQVVRAERECHDGQANFTRVRRVARQPQSPGDERAERQQVEAHADAQAGDRRPERSLRLTPTALVAQVGACKRPTPKIPNRMRSHRLFDP